MRAALRWLALLVERDDFDERACFLGWLFAGFAFDRDVFARLDVRLAPDALVDLDFDEEEDDLLKVLVELTDERPDPADRLWLERYFLLSDAISVCRRVLPSNVYMRLPHNIRL